MNEQSQEQKIHIRAADVKKSFKVGSQDVQVLQGVTFDVPANDFCVILGPSGSGKSTLLHTLLGLEVPSAGRVDLLGTDIYKDTTEDDRSAFRKKHIGMVFQQPNWIKSLSVIENVIFPLLLLGADKTESFRYGWKALENVHMQDWANYKPTELSGGQQQKASVARAIVTNPEIIVADEPTGNLDYQSGLYLMELLVSLNLQGKTIMMVTHDLEYIKYAKTAVKILDGKVEGVYKGNDKQTLAENIKSKRAVDIDVQK